MIYTSPSERSSRLAGELAPLWPELAAPNISERRGGGGGQNWITKPGHDRSGGGGGGGAINLPYPLGGLAGAPEAGVARATINLSGRQSSIPLFAYLSSWLAAEAGRS